MKVIAINPTISQCKTKINSCAKKTEPVSVPEEQNEQNVSFKAKWKRLFKPRNLIGAICTFGLAIPFIVSEDVDDDPKDGDCSADEFNAYYYSRMP